MQSPMLCFSKKHVFHYVYYYDMSCLGIEAWGIFCFHALFMMLQFLDKYGVYDQIAWHDIIA